MKSGLVAFALTLFALQAPSTEPPRAAVEEQKPPPASEGLWPSPRMRDLLLTRWVDEVGHRFKLDEKQTEQLRESVVRRWGGFIEENRTSLEPLINGFLEMHLGSKPPSKALVESWARDALPMFKKTRAQFDEGKADFREVLGPLQRARFELRVLEFGVGMNFLEQRLTQLSEGGVDDVVREMFWEPPGLTPTERRRRRRGLRRERAEAIQQAARAEAAATDHVEVELTRWEQYAVDFIRRYNLDEGQRTTARSCLSELSERARAHRDRRRDDMTRIESRIAGFSGSEKELAVLKEQLTELYGPIDDMFKELQSRLAQIPTSAQRARAEQEQQEESQPDEPPAKPTTPGG